MRTILARFFAAARLPLLAMAALLSVQAPARADDTASDPAAKVAPDTGKVREVARFDPPRFTAHPEGLAVDKQGNVYVGLLGSGEVFKFAPDGTMSLLGMLDVVPDDAGKGESKIPKAVVVGLAVDGNNNVYVAALTHNLPGTDTHGVWRIRPDGTKELAGAVPDADTAVNQVAIGPDGAIYVSDSHKGTVWRIARGEKVAKLWLQHPLLMPASHEDNPCKVTSFFGGTNGVAFDPKGDMYVASANRAAILKVKIDRKTGKPTASEFIRDCARLTALDHMAFDVKGNLYVARNVENEIVRISPDKQITVMATAADGLDFPANVAFGTGPAAIGTGAGNRTQLYITNMGSRGRHALMVMDVGIAGLPLPMPVDIK